MELPTITLEEDEMPANMRLGKLLLATMVGFAVAELVKKGFDAFYEKSQEDPSDTPSDV